MAHELTITGKLIFTDPNGISLGPIYISHLLALHKKDWQTPIELGFDYIIQELCDLSLVSYDGNWVQITYLGSLWLFCADLIPTHPARYEPPVDCPPDWLADFLGD